MNQWREVGAFLAKELRLVTTLVSFDRTNGADPKAALIKGSDGNLYGATYVGGECTTTNRLGGETIFRIVMRPPGSASSQCRAREKSNGPFLADQCRRICV